MKSDDQRAHAREAQSAIERATRHAEPLPYECCRCRRNAVIMFEPNGDPKRPRPENAKPFCARCFGRLSAGLR